MPKKADSVFGHPSAWWTSSARAIGRFSSSPEKSSGDVSNSTRAPALRSGEIFLAVSGASASRISFKSSVIGLDLWRNWESDPILISPCQSQGASSELHLNGFGLDRTLRFRPQRLNPPISASLHFFVVNALGIITCI